MGTSHLTLLTDLYELTMMQGYFKNNTNEKVIFDVFYRSNPEDAAYSITAGLAQVIEYIEGLHFDDADIDYLRSTGFFMKTFLNI